MVYVGERKEELLVTLNDKARATQGMAANEDESTPLGGGSVNDL